MTAEHFFPKSISQSSPNLTFQQTKAPPGAQAAAEEGLSTPTRCTAFQTCPLVLEAELLIKHHLPGSVEANWGWAGAKEKLPNYTWKKKKIPPTAPNSHLQPARAAGYISFRLVTQGPGLSLCTENPHSRIRLSPVPPFAGKSPGVVPHPHHTHSRAQEGAHARTHTHTLHNPSKRKPGVCAC